MFNNRHIVFNYKDDGNVSAEDQWDRLEAGAWSGVAFSTGCSKWCR